MHIGILVANARACFVDLESFRDDARPAFPGDHGFCKNLRPTGRHRVVIGLPRVQLRYDLASVFPEQWLKRI